MSGQPVSVVLRIDGMSATLVGQLVAAGVADHFVREQDDGIDPTFTGSTIPLTVVEVASLVESLAWGPVPAVPAQHAATEVIPAVREPRTYGAITLNGKPWAYCPDHPLWEPLHRDGIQGDRLVCTANHGGAGPTCGYSWPDPERRYANS